MNIVVLAGGISTERAVSIVSGTGVCRALRERGHRAVLVDVYGGVEKDASRELFPEAYDVDEAAAYIRSFDEKIEQMQASGREFFGPGVLELCRAAEVVFLALHGADGENGKVQAAFDLFGIRYTGTGHLSSALAMDKGLSRRLMQAAGVPMPEGTKLVKGMETGLAGLGLACPVVVKPCCGGSSVGVSIARDPEEYEAALKEAFSYEEEVIVEEYVAGREFSVGVVDGKALPVIEIAPLNGFYDYKNKYSAGATVETCPARITEEQTVEMQRLALLGNDALGIRGYSRLDFLMGEDGRICCLEANTLPGMTPTSLIPQEAAALGMGYGEFCERLIQVSIQ
jgi:D-alanine-D-alanine ligase